MAPSISSARICKPISTVGRCETSSIGTEVISCRPPAPACLAEHPAPPLRRTAGDFFDEKGRRFFRHGEGVPRFEPVPGFVNEQIKCKTVNQVDDISRFLANTSHRV